jgi:hypothetical protein
LPHVWLSDGDPLHDRLGHGYTLLKLGRSEVDTRGFETAMQETGAPFGVLDIRSEAAREIYGMNLVLVRPDLHVAWRGSTAPENPAAVAARVTGRTTSA